MVLNNKRILRTPRGPSSVRCNSARTTLTEVMLGPELASTTGIRPLSACDPSDVSFSGISNQMYLEELHRETEEYICWRSGIKYEWPITVVNLWALPEHTSAGIPLMDLAMLAIWGSIEKRLTSTQICEAINKRFPGDTDERKKSRCNVVKYELSKKSVFQRLESGPTHHRLRGRYWIVNINAERKKRDTTWNKSVADWRESVRRVPASSFGDLNLGYGWSDFAEALIHPVPRGLNHEPLPMLARVSQTKEPVGSLNVKQDIDTYCQGLSMDNLGDFGELPSDFHFLLQPRDIYNGRFPEVDPYGSLTSATPSTCHRRSHAESFVPDKDPFERAAKRRRQDH